MQSKRLALFNGPNRIGTSSPYFLPDDGDTDSYLNGIGTLLQTVANVQRTFLRHGTGQRHIPLELHKHLLIEILIVVPDNIKLLNTDLLMSLWYIFMPNFTRIISYRYKIKLNINLLRPPY
jgi:hypothetical protein